jgi:NADH dehydrogenase
MNVVVVGASGKMGRRVIPVLVERGHQVTAFVRRAGALPVATACIANWPDNPAAIPALLAADSIVNLAGDGNPPRGVSYDQANSEPCERIHTLLGGVRAPHLVFISYPGAAADERSAYLRAKARGEEVSRRSAMRVAILRTSFVCGSRDQPLASDRALVVPRGRKAPMFGTGETRCRPVCMTDVVQAIVAVVEQRLEGEFALEGPEEMTLLELVRTLNANPAQPVRAVPAWLALIVGPLMGMRRDFVRFFLADALDAHRNVFAATGVRAHRVAEMWPLET